MAAGAAGPGGVLVLKVVEEGHKSGQGLAAWIPMIYPVQETHNKRGIAIHGTVQVCTHFVTIYKST